VLSIQTSCVPQL